MTFVRRHPKPSRRPAPARPVRRLYAEVLESRLALTASPAAAEAAALDGSLSAYLSEAQPMGPVNPSTAEVAAPAPAAAAAAPITAAEADAMADALAAALESGEGESSTPEIVSMDVWTGMFGMMVIVDGFVSDDEPDGNTIRFGGPLAGFLADVDQFGHFHGEYLYMFPGTITANAYDLQGNISPTVSRTV